MWSLEQSQKILILEISEEQGNVKCMLLVVCMYLCVCVCYVCIIWKDTLKMLTNDWLWQGRYRVCCWGDLFSTVHPFTLFEFCNHVHILPFQMKNAFSWISYYLELRSMYILCQVLEFGRQKLISSLFFTLTMLLNFHRSSNSGFEGG